MASPEPVYGGLASKERPTTAVNSRQGLRRGSLEQGATGTVGGSFPGLGKPYEKMNGNHSDPSDLGIMKRHSYPTPDSSPDSTVTRAARRARSNTCPTSAEEPTKRCVGRISSLLGEFDKAVEFPHARDAGTVAMTEDQMEVDAVPGFFCGDAISVGPAVGPDGPGLEADLMDPEFIAVTVEDLDTSFLDLEDPFSRCVERSRSDVSEESGTQKLPGGLQKPCAASNAGSSMLTVQARGHPKSDSGVGSTLGSPGKGFSFKEYKDSDYQGAGDLYFGELGPYGGAGAPVEAIYNLRIDGDACGDSSRDGSPDSAAGPGYRGLVEFGDVGVSCDIASSFEDITPPSSASPSPSALSHEVSDLPRRHELAPESIDAMIKLILYPITSNPIFGGFRVLCMQAIDRLYSGKICWLRDLEKFLLLSAPDIRSSSSYKAFCKAFLQGCQRAIVHIREQDQRRSYDPEYSQAYFIDTLDQLGKLADEWVRPVRVSVDNRSIGPIGLANAQQRLPPAVAAKTRARQSHPIRQPLAILTQPSVAGYTSYRETDGLSPSNPGFPMNSDFSYDQTLGAKMMLPTMTVSLSSDAPGNHSQAMASQPAGYTMPPTPVSSEYSGSPVAPPSSSVGPGNTAVPGGRIPAQGSGPEKDGILAFPCDLCPKEFPRACDLTKHKKTHERPFKCEVTSCKYHTEGFPTGKERERHQNDIHSENSKEWSCHFPPCTYKSKRESNCKQHMEKSHGYIYRRMKRNPRRQQSQVQTAGVKKRRGENGKAAAGSLSAKVTRALEQQQHQPESSKGAAMSAHHQFAEYRHAYPQQSTAGYNFMHPSQMVHPSLYGGSPTTDFEPSPVPGSQSYTNSLGAYGAPGSIIDGPDWFPEPQSQKEFMENFYSDMPENDCQYIGIQQSPPLGPQQFGSPGHHQFDEGMDCEWEGGDGPGPD